METKEGTSSYTSILWGLQRLDWRPTDAPFVVRLATIGATWGNTWRTFTSLALSPTLANTARLEWLSKRFPPELNFKTMFPPFTSPSRSLLLTEVWSFQDLVKVSQIPKSFFNLSRRTKTRTLASISGCARFVARGSSAELLCGIIVRAFILRECSDTTATFVRRRCPPRALSTIMWQYITTRQGCRVLRNCY